jgi:3-phosphoshikimate 1-carboxyvinyltransferase
VAGCPPITIQGGRLTGGRVAVDASKSSQFLSALVMVAPLADDEVEIVAMPITSRPYVDLTLTVMNAFGISVALRGDDTSASRGQKYRARSFAIEPDATAATYFCTPRRSRAGASA